MTNQALPQRSRQLVEHHLDSCQNLALILDKFAPWGTDQRGNWDLTMRSTVRRRGQNQIQTLTGGEAKGLWLSTSRRALQGESPSLFEVGRTDIALMQAHQQRWFRVTQANNGVAFSMRTSERLAAGLGASHVLETALTLERNTGLPYLPGSTVKGLARAWGLIEVAAQVGITLSDDPNDDGLNKLAEILMSDSENHAVFKDITQWGEVNEDVETFVTWFRFVFGTQDEAGAICFLDAIYYGDDPPRYAADVMTPHYVKYYTESGGSAPAEDDNPNPVSFITVDAGNSFAFGLVPRHSAFSQYEGDERAGNIQKALAVAQDWLVQALFRLGAGSKTAAGYGFFSNKSFKEIE